MEFEIVEVNCYQTDILLGGIRAGHVIIGAEGFDAFAGADKVGTAETAPEALSMALDALEAQADAGIGPAG